MGQPDLSRPGDRLQIPSRRHALFRARDLAFGAALASALAAGQSMSASTAPVVQAMHGFADQQGITLWLQGRSALRLRIETRRVDAAASEPPRTHTVDLDPAADATAQLRIGDLEPGTAYRYAIADAQGVLLAEGRFRTQALWQWRGDPPTLRLAVGSCAYLNDGRFDRPGTPYGGG